MKFLISRTSSFLRARITNTSTAFNRQGFSLLEVVVAMAIISVGVVTVLQIFSSGLRLVARTSIVTDVAAQGRAVMDEALSQNTIPEGGAGATGVNGGSWKVETRPVGAEKGFTLSQPWSLEEVQVEVRVRAGLGEKEMTLRTLRLVKGRPRL